MNTIPSNRVRISKHTTVPETDESVERIIAILQLQINDTRPNTEDAYFWDSCYPWVETNEETAELLQEAYQHFGHDL